MRDFATAIATLKALGYTDANVEEKLAQDIVLDALSRSPLRGRATIKGGVVMASLTGDIRRTTLDIDLDFMCLGLDEPSIRSFVQSLNHPGGVAMSVVGDIVELRQQDYRGRRAFLELRDGTGATLQAKLDIGVHVHDEARQVEGRFAVPAVSESPALLLSNPPEQIFAEKLKSLLRLGPISNRGKDVFDMAYLSGHVDRGLFAEFLRTFVFEDARMLETDMDGVLRRLRRTFSDPNFLSRISHRRSNWMQVDPREAMERVILFLASLPAK